MSRVLPILFNTDMVRAIPDGRKTVTRRIIMPHNRKKAKEQGYHQGNGLWIDDSSDNPDKTGHIKDYSASPCWMSYNWYIERYAPYQPGDILYVREAWRVETWNIRNQMIAFDYKDGTCRELLHIHDRELFERLVNQSREDARKVGRFVWEKGKSPCRWHPSIHMPKEAARIWLKVTDVRVERLQDITEEQAQREGIQEYTKDGKLYKYAVTDDWWIVFHYKRRKSFAGNWWQDMPRTAKEAFSYLWNSTLKKSDLARYGWDANPWVWAIEFEQCEKPEEGQNE